MGQPALGLACVAAAFLTAYVRELGVTCGAPADFRGPMAKPHRMALITGAAVVAAFEPLWDGTGAVLRAALWILLAGTAVTAARRVRSIIGRLRRTGRGNDRGKRSFPQRLGAHSTITRPKSFTGLSLVI